MVNCFYGKPREGMTLPKLRFYPKQLEEGAFMDDQKLDIWTCSCCGNLFDGATEQPVNFLSSDLFECSLCDVVNTERQLSDCQF